MNFHEYCELLRSEVLEFREDCEWDINEWNDSYIDFWTGLKAYKKEYIKSKTIGELVVEWAREFYLGTTSETHNYWVVKKIDGWYCAETSKPEKNVGVLVLIPAEGNHITSGMWDIDNKWVLLDDYRVVPSEKPEMDGDKEISPSIVVYWRPLPALPTIES